VNQEAYSFIRYLEAKKSVDDRAINRHVWQVLSGSLPQTSPEKPLRIVEMGAGIGTMIERMIEWELLDYANYTAIDAQAENIQHAQQRLLYWSSDHGYHAVKLADGLKILGEGVEISINLIEVDLFDFFSDQNNLNSFDLLVAHAFLDLVDLPATLPQIISLGQDGCIFNFTINYDGLTIFEPVIDDDFDKHVLELYHRTMRERIHDGKRFGDNQAGRHLFNQIQESGGRILAAGSSDWIVYPISSGYHQDEAYFLHFIIHTIYQALKDIPELDLEQFEQWIRQRHAQIERQELVYIAHQLDYVGSIQR
jgi:hypothetical protein